MPKLFDRIFIHSNIRNYALSYMRPTVWCTVILSRGPCAMFIEWKWRKPKVESFLTNFHSATDLIQLNIMHRCKRHTLTKKNWCDTLFKKTIVVCSPHHCPKGLHHIILKCSFGRRRSCSTTSSCWCCCCCCYCCFYCCYFAPAKNNLITNFTF